MDDLRRHPVTSDWLHRQRAESTATTTTRQQRHYWTDNPQQLITTEPTQVHSLNFGTGQSIFENSILPHIDAAQHEVLFVTCFWARSATLNALNNTLLRLSAKAAASGRKIRVRLGFSSSSLFQKLFHPFSPSGKQWPPAKWQHSLGLPSPETLNGLDMSIKSVFILPFSVMHPKLIIIDRKRVLLPSCNVSWEEWFEGCVDLSGPIVNQFLRFWNNFWADGNDRTNESEEFPELSNALAMMPSSSYPRLLSHQNLDLSGIHSIFLPSPHSRNPNFSLIPWQSCPSPPSTPLNTFLLSAFANAKQEIYLQTPNLTAPPALSALLAALQRGVDVSILTSERLMILEQLVTAGTTTARCIRKLVRRYDRLRRNRSSTPNDIEAGQLISRLGRLRIRFFEPAGERTTEVSTPEPVQSHLKLTLVDGEWTIFGSGNMDRASWFTSQELGVAFCSRNFAAKVRAEVDNLMETRSRCVYDSRGAT